MATLGSEGETPLRPLRILSVEDDPKSISGTLSALRRDGHVTRSVLTAEDAEEPLRRRIYDLLLVDEKLPEKRGAELVLEVKDGKYGRYNAQADFVMLTGNPDWVPKERLMKLPGYLPVTRKGKPLQKPVKEVVEKVRAKRPVPGSGSLRRVIIQVAEIDNDQVAVVVPSWDASVSVTVERARLPGGRYAHDGDLADRHFFAWINLEADAVEELDMTKFEAAGSR
jgi:DNA-binding response OmpR family regulator